MTSPKIAVGDSIKIKANLPIGTWPTDIPKKIMTKTFTIMRVDLPGSILVKLPKKYGRPTKVGGKTILGWWFSTKDIEKP